jgi:pyruvate/2-oxoglutarate dehydrogenase complex dihydrolipoamide acyltransferase (E2) component
VKSPVRGIVRDLYVQEGEEVRTGWWLMQIGDMEKGVVHAMMDEPDFFRVTIGARAGVKLVGLPDRIFTGRVSAIADWPGVPPWYRAGTGRNKAQPGKLFQVTIELEEEPPMCVGMSAVVEILAPTEPRAKEVKKHGGVD